MKMLKLVFKGDVNNDFLNEKKYIFCIVLMQQKKKTFNFFGSCIFHVLSVNIIRQV